MSNRIPNAKYQIRNFVLNFDIYLKFAMNHVRFMIRPELYAVQETLTFDIIFMMASSSGSSKKGQRR
jgi:hypothetical protein